MKRSVLTSARLLREDMERGGFRYRAAFITLTYHRVDDWQPLHVSQLVKRCREHFRRRGWVFRYVWVHELQERGATHYHMVVWMPLGHKLPMLDAAGWWPWGSSNMQFIKNKHAVGYCVKYSSKGGDDRRIPKGARLTSSGGLSTFARLERAWWLAPGWVREGFTVENRPVRAPGGGWVSKVTGDWLPSPWKLVDRAVDWSWCQFELREVCA